jgi:hypothetical protein
MALQIAFIIFCFMTGIAIGFLVHHYKKQVLWLDASVKRLRDDLHLKNIALEVANSALASRGRENRKLKVEMERKQEEKVDSETETKTGRMLMLGDRG